MTFTIRPAIREATPLIVGLAGPTKSGKTKSAHRLMQGMVPGGKIVMLNAEGARGHQYADQYSYLACDIERPYRPTRYTEALREIAAMKPDGLIIDSASHMHDGPGGMLEWHDEELQRLAGNRTGKERDRYNWTAWIKPKQAENEFIYTMLEMRCPVVLCFRAKEKLKIIPGKEPIDLGWQPIASDRVAFETIFTLVLPPFSKGVPDLSISEMREPFDRIVPAGKPIDEDLGRKLSQWAAGGAPAQPAPRESDAAPVEAHASAGEATEHITADQQIEIDDLITASGAAKGRILELAGVKSLAMLPAADYADLKATLQARVEKRQRA